MREKGLKAARSQAQKHWEKDEDHWLKNNTRQGETRAKGRCPPMLPPNTGHPGKKIGHWAHQHAPLWSTTRRSARQMHTESLRKAVLGKWQTNWRALGRGIHLDGPPTNPFFGKHEKKVGRFRVQDPGKRISLVTTPLVLPDPGSWKKYHWSPNRKSPRKTPGNTYFSIFPALRGYFVARRGQEQKIWLRAVPSARRAKGAGILDIANAFFWPSLFSTPWL